MRRNLVLSLVFAMLLLALVPLLGGCSAVTGQETTATLDQTDPDATQADAAIAGITQSGNITVPADIETGILRVGSDESYPPLAFRAVFEETEGEEVKKTVKAVGFEVDLCTAIAKKMGLSLEVVSTRWGDIVPALLEDRVDVIASAVIVTTELEQQVAFTDPHLDNVFTISTPVGAPVTDAAGLSGKTVGVQLGSVAHDHLMTIAGVAEVKTYKTIVEAFADLGDGNVQAVVTDTLISAYVLENDTELSSKVANTGTIATDSGYAFAVEKEDAALLAAMNAALGELRAEGVYEKICAKWDVTGN